MALMPLIQIISSLELPSWLQILIVVVVVFRKILFEVKINLYVGFSAYLISGKSGFFGIHCSCFIKKHNNEIICKNSAHNRRK